MPPHTRKKKTTNLKTKNNQNCQKIKLYGSLTTKDLKRNIHPDRSEGQRQAARLERTGGKVVAGGRGRGGHGW